MDHHHHHHHHAAEDQPDDVPFDSANQSLADALRASFRILKIIMFLMVIVFLASGVKIVDTSEEAVVLHFGKLQLAKDGKPYQPGFLLAYPYPVDEVLRLPAKERNTLKIKSHWFFIRPADEDKSTTLLAQGYSRPLDPVTDGALLTGDRGMVHFRWTVVYRIEDLKNYVLNVSDTTGTKVDQIITALLESAAIRTVAEYTAEQAYREKTTEIADRVKADVNNALEQLATGIRIESLEPETTVPMSTLGAFSEVTNAMNRKGSEIQEARKQAGEMLAAAAGEVHVYVTALMDLRDAVARDGHADLAEALDVAIDRAFTPSATGTVSLTGGPFRTPALARDEILDAFKAWENALAGGDDGAVEREAVLARLRVDPGFRVTGRAGSQLVSAKAYYTKTVQKMRGEVEVYQAVLAEYERNPDLLINRLWDQARTKLMTASGVTKIGLPVGVRGLWFQIGPDPQQRELDELEKITKELKEKGMTATLRPTIRALGGEDH